MLMRDFAHHIIAVANDNGLSITNLQLHKVMYFTLKRALNDNSLNSHQLDRMYDSPFLVWRYGPVEKNIYETYNVFVSDPIIESDIQVGELLVLNKTIIHELNENPFQLVNISRQELFWKRHESDIAGWRSNVTYSLDNIKTGC